MLARFPPMTLDPIIFACSLRRHLVDTKDTKSLAVIKSALELCLSIAKTSLKSQAIDIVLLRLKWITRNEDKVISQHLRNISTWLHIPRKCTWTILFDNYPSLRSRTTRIFSARMSIESIQRPWKYDNLFATYIPIYGANCLANSEHRFNRVSPSSRVPRLEAKANPNTRYKLISSV